ncbi:hypothetical protein GCM10010468_01270 [Actinocorallia longicatena]|uniref:Uncharacterized protein n=1 Tax=Actinocorallia longicatena TaxID=111803 RepID=A0ABP6PWJ7_9ACTN
MRSTAAEAENSAAGVTSREIPGLSRTASPQAGPYRGTTRTSWPAASPAPTTASPAPPSRDAFGRRDDTATLIPASCSKGVEA